MRWPRVALALALAALAAPVALVAGAVGPLTTFVNGTVADADEVNANFAAVRTASDDNHARLTTLEGRFAGATPLPASAAVPTGTHAVGATYFDTVEKSLRVWDGATWVVIGARIGTVSLPATSASAIKAALGFPANGPYFYTLNGVTQELYTDFTTYPAYPMVLVTRIAAGENTQYVTTERNVGDLTAANTTAPTRSAKLSDADLNTIIAANTVRWTILGNKAVFYRHNDSWTSNFGTVGNCGYTTPYLNAFATPSNTPGWTAFGSTAGGCGGGKDAAGNWLLLSGIHANDAANLGGHVGSAAALGTAPAAYATASTTANTWGNPGYVFLSW